MQLSFNFVFNELRLVIAGLQPVSLLLPVMESSRTCPWPRGSLRTHFQVLGLGLGLVAHVLGLGLGLVKFSMTHRCTDTAAKKVLMIRAKTVRSHPDEM